VPHPIEQHAIRLIAYSYHDHMSYKDISVLLNTHTFELPDGSKVQFRTKGVKNLRAPGKFTADAIHILIRNPFHAGYMAHDPTASLNMRDDIEHLERIKNTVDFHRTPIELHQGQHQPLYPVQIWEENQKIVSSQFCKQNYVATHNKKEISNRFQEFFSINVIQVTLLFEPVQRYNLLNIK
jgi:hypothetical protein